MNIKQKIAAVVVTFNRSKLLSECLNGLYKSSKMLDAIYVIDNASTDDTYLVCERYKNKNNFTYIRMDVNTGGAGGFAEGISRAYEAGYDWIWLMDDDVEPYSDALENLLKYESFGKCIHGVRTNPDGSIFKWGAIFDPKLITLRKMDYKNIFQNSNIAQMNNGCFEGMLIHRDVVEEIGFPNKELFITWDDTYYGFLAAKFTNVLYVNVLSLKRKREIESKTSWVSGYKISLGAFASYFHFRNKFYLAAYLGVGSKYFFVYSLLELLKTNIKDLILFRDFGRVKKSWLGFYDGYKKYGALFE